MKLMRVGPRGREQAALLDSAGQLRSLAGMLPDINGEALSPAGLQRLRAIAPEQLPRLPGDLMSERPGVPWVGLGKIVCIGLNYADHAAEAGMALPTEPIVFLKPASCAVGAQDAVLLPPGSEKTDWEVELGVVIGSTAAHVAEADALAHVAGYCVINDVSERSYQLERGGTWDKGKGCDSFAPVGPMLVTADEVPDPQALALWLDVNGQPRQRGNTRTMVFGVAQLISYVSRFMTLHPGDLLATGTPPGVGMAMKPPQYLKAGDEVRLGISGLGEQRLPVRPWVRSE